MVLKNKRGEVMVVGDCYLLGKLGAKQAVNFDVFVAKQRVTTLRYNTLAKESFNTLISYEDGAFSENYVFEMNKEYAVGGYKIQYLAVDDDMVGIRVDFDDIKIFIASDENLSYNEFNQIYKLHQFDVVVADYQTAEGNFIHISNSKVDGSDYSYQTNGNFGLVGEGLKIRRLD